MSTHAYEVARLHATSEIAEINAQMVKLIQRKDLIRKLLELLDQLESASSSIETPALRPDAPAIETLASEISAHEFRDGRAEGQGDQTIGLHSHGLHDYLEALARSAAKVTELFTADSERFTHEQIAALAYRFWVERGSVHGHDKEDWTRADRELRAGDAL